MYEIKDCAKVLRINLMNKRITNQVFISRILSIIDHPHIFDSIPLKNIIMNFS